MMMICDNEVEETTNESWCRLIAPERAVQLASWEIQTAINSIAIPSEYYVRQTYIDKFGFAVLSKELADVISNYPKVLEVGAGTGYIASVCPNIIATDKYSERKPWWKPDNFHTTVLDMDATTAYQKFKNNVDAILISWPYMIERSAWFNKVLEMMKPEQHLIYIGEGHGGCTGNDMLYNQLDTIFDHVARVPIPKFKCIHDTANIYQRI